MHKLDDAGIRFEFGANWASFLEAIDEQAIAEAEQALCRLVPRDDFPDRSFIDIGCGSGLHALAAMRLGAKRVQAIDIDEESVNTAKTVLARFDPDGQYSIEKADVLELDPAKTGQFDIVYSWGVLHHTGNLDAAMRKAASLVAPDGLFAFALYRRTPFDKFWIWEKHWYSRAGETGRKFANAAYIGLVRLGVIARGRSYRQFVDGCKGRRGMDFFHDVRDWLGGYPYETCSPVEVQQLMAELGFHEVRSFTQSTPLAGLLGSGCDEYVYSR